MNNDNNLNASDIVSSTSVENITNTNEGETNESVISSNSIQNENITDEGNKSQSTVENISTPNTNEDQVDNSNGGGCSTSTSEIEKPIETYKKVKLKRSHILKKLSTPMTANVQPHSSTDSEQSTKSNEITTENMPSNPLNIDIPEDNISTSFDFDINDASSNSDSTCSPTPRKKVKLIRNNPRFKSNIVKTSPVQVVSTAKDECEVTTSSSPKINAEFTISLSEENVTLNDPKSNIDVKSAYKMHPDNDIADVVAQIDQIIGPDDGTVPSTSFLDTDDLSLSDGLKNDDLSIIEELEKEINAIPPTNESSNDVMEKIVDDLDEICTTTDQPQKIIESTIENKAENIETTTQSENFTIEETSECPKEANDLSIEVEKHQINDEDYNIDLDDRVESVDDLEKKLLDVSAQVDSLDCSESMQVDEILESVTEQPRVEDFATNSDNIHSIILSDNNLQNSENSDDIGNNSGNIENENILSENVEINPKNVDQVENNKNNSEIPEESIGEINIEAPKISSNKNQNSSVEAISSSSDRKIDLPTTSSIETSELPKITLTIKKSEIQKPVESETPDSVIPESIKIVDSTNVEMKSEFQSEEVISSTDVKRVPKLTIKPIKKPSSETETTLTIKTVKPESLEAQIIKPTESIENETISTSTISSTLEAIPKLTIRNLKKSQDEDLEVIQSTSTENVEKEVVPKLTIKPLKKPPQQSNQTQMHVVTSEIKEIIPEVIPKLTIKTKIIPNEENQQTSESISTVESIPKLTIKTGKKIEAIEKDIKQCPNIDSSNLESSIQGEESLPKITIKNTADKSFEIIPNASISLSEESSADESVDYTHSISAANKSSLAAANMELIPRSMKNKNRTQAIDSDDEEIEVIPSVSDKNSSEFIPKLSIKALKKSLQSDKEMGNHPEEPNFKSIPTSTSSKLIIKPILNAPPNLSKIKKTDNSLASQSLLKTVDLSESKDYGMLLKNNQKRNEPTTETAILNTKSPSRKMVNIPGNKNYEDEEINSKNDRIVLKINKDNESMKSQLKSENTLKVDTTSSPLEKITLKLSKEGGHPEILSPSSFSKTMPTQNPSLKRMLSPETTIEPIQVEKKKMKPNETSIEFSSGDVSINIIKSNTSATKKLQNISDDVTIVRVPSQTPQPTKIELGNNSSKLKDILMKLNANRIDVQPEDDGDSSSSDDVKIVDVIPPAKMNVDPLSISNDESSSQDVMIVEEILPDPIEELKPDLPPVPKKRGRPRKIPLEVRPELKEEEPEESVITVNELPIEDSPAPSPAQPSDEDDNFELSPKGAYNIRGIRRGGAYRSRRGRGGRGSRGGRGAYKRRAEEKRRALMDLQSVITSDVTVALDKIDVDKKSLLKMKADGSAEAFFMEEDTRMSADGELGETGTHIKPEITDESRSSSTTTENNRNKRGRLEITEIEVFKHVTGPEQIAEYHWRNGGPYMLQEQIAQYLGVKSFKRKYPGLTRHAVEMQERDYIRENGLASEALCDMGLTAVLSSEILDIMFTDFQDKYEEYRKYQREKQAKDVTNKQRAMASSMATNADKGDKEESVLQLAIRSAASWNASLNKSRKEERKCYVDLQSFTVMYPKGRKPVAPNTNPGHYPVALVPGQFSEFYKNYSPTELKYLPVNTVLYGPIVQNASIQEIGYSDGSCSESESSSGSDSESSEDSDSTTMDGITTPLTNPPILHTESDTCKICITSSPKSRPGKSSLIYCAQCNQGIHPRCIDLTVEMMPFIQAYPWQCTDCKTCWQCRRPSDDDKMLFCDRCDRGYHIYCVGLRKVPNGRWHCQQCTMTTSTNTAITHSVSVAT